MAVALTLGDGGEEAGPLGGVDGPVGPDSETVEAGGADDVSVVVVGTALV